MIIAIAILSAIDIICTGYGVSNGFISEGNPIVAYLFNWSVWGTCAIIAVLVGLLLWFISRHKDQYRWLRYALAGVTLVKAIVVAIHAVWIISIL